MVDRGADPVVALAPEGLALGPAGGDVDGHEGRQVEARGGLATVGHEIGLEGPRLDVLPVAEGAEGDLRGERGMAGAGGREAAGGAAAVRAEETVDRGGAEPQERRAQGSRDLKGAVALEGVHEGGEEGREAFAAEVVAGLPHLVQKGGDLRAVTGGPAWRGRGGRGGWRRRRIADLRWRPVRRQNSVNRRAFSAREAAR